MYQGKRNFGKQSVHDLVVRSVLPLWRNPARYNIEINPGSEKNMWAGSPAHYPDLVGWVRKNGQNTLAWVAEVETEETVNDAEARSQWRGYAALGVPFYLIVPSGHEITARILAVGAGVTLAGVYGFAFPNNTFLLT